MMLGIEDGDRVVYVRLIEEACGILNIGSTYVVQLAVPASEMCTSECSIHGPNCDHDGLVLENTQVVIDSFDMAQIAWCAGCFRKIGDPDGLARSLGLMIGVKKRELEDA